MLSTQANIASASVFHLPYPIYLQFLISFIYTEQHLINFTDFSFFFFNTLPQLRSLEIYETKQSGKLAQNNHKFMMKVQLDRRKTYLKIEE